MSRGIVATGLSLNPSTGSLGPPLPPTQLLLHFDGEEGSQVFPDSSSYGYTISVVGAVDVDTAVKKWGTGSGYFSGNPDRLYCDECLNWDITLDWTVDFWAKHDLPVTEDYVCQLYDTSNRWKLYHLDGLGLRFNLMVGGETLVDTGAPTGGEIEDTAWHHIALCKVGDRWAIYLDGDQVVYLLDSDLDTFAGPLYIGHSGSGTKYYFTGHMEELKISRENHFGRS